ncbi:uncharacterized protein LOC132256498 isoform X2 [Phlebotomus argentipes]|uniref:uncharacterized protein LOC132256498 isoform X2 n=1 Tax=Phlebotomus argentipes TaxID=94469 RepID=UPI002893358D|nr:uncharacterized protein LOC132256498 isoform X2 [Phlebotomus argentipes]
MPAEAAEPGRSRVRIKAKFYSMQKYYRLVKMRATICGNSTFEWKHFSDFAYFDAVLEHPNGSEGSTSAGQAGVFTDDMDEEADEQIVIEHPSSHELLCVNDMDTKESIVISSDEDLDISGANIKRESAMSQRRRAQSMFRDFPDRSDTPATTSQSGVMNGTSRDDGIRLEDQKFCDFLASRMKDMTKEQARDIQMKILMLLNKEC